MLGCLVVIGYFVAWLVISNLLRYWLIPGAMIYLDWFFPGALAYLISIPILLVLRFGIPFLIEKVLDASEAASANHERKQQEAEQRAWIVENEKLAQSARQGDVNAAFKLGERYRSKSNREEAMKWFRMAADGGHEEAGKVFASMEAEQKAKEEAEKRAKAEQEAREEAKRKVKEDELKWARENFNLAQDRAASKGKAGDHYGAIHDWEILAEIDPRFKHNLFLEHYNIALDSFRANDLTTADSEIWKALKYEPGDFQAEELRHGIYMAQSHSR